ncbi:hypothetical protein GCM10027162_66690 [Streptomyces incanus]
MSTEGTPEAPRHGEEGLPTRGDDRGGEEGRRGSAARGLQEGKDMENPLPRHFQRIAHRGDCGKAPGMAHNRSS